VILIGKGQQERLDLHQESGFILTIINPCSCITS